MPRFGSLLWQSAKEWQADSAPRMGAALAYYSVFSIPPLLLLTLGICGVFLDRQSVEGRVMGEVSSLVGPLGADAIRALIAGATRDHSSGILATVIGLLTLLFGASGVFAELKSSLNDIWDVRASARSGVWQLLRERLVSFSMVLGMGFLMLVSLLVSTFLGLLLASTRDILPGPDLVAGLVDFGVSLAVISLIFASIYRFLPDARVSWRTAFVGGLSTALLFMLGKYLIGIYLGTSNIASTFGAAGSFVLLLAWIYYSAQIFMFGAELTKQYALARGETIELKPGLAPR